MAYMFLNHNTLLSLCPEGLEKRHVKWGNRTRADNPDRGTPAQCRRIRGLQEARGGPGEFMSCQVASGRSFH